jgi:hypothetical protein
MFRFLAMRSLLFWTAPGSASNKVASAERVERFLHVCPKTMLF